MNMEQLQILKERYEKYRGWFNRFVWNRAISGVRGYEGGWSVIHDDGTSEVFWYTDVDYKLLPIWVNIDSDYRHEVINTAPAEFKNRAVLYGLGNPKKRGFLDFLFRGWGFDITTRKWLNEGRLNLLNGRDKNILYFVDVSLTHDSVLSKMGILNRDYTPPVPSEDQNIPDRIRQLIKDKKRLQDELRKVTEERDRLCVSMVRKSRDMREKGWLDPGEAQDLRDQIARMYETQKAISDMLGP